jgi:transcriptional regulator with XRE-family HTH domain
MEYKKLRELRDKRGLTQADAARQLGIAPTTYASYEQGKREPDDATKMNIAKLYGVTVDYLLGINRTPEWATEKQVTDLKEWLNDPDANVGLSFGGAELTKEEKEKLKMSVTQIFWDRLKLERMPLPDARYMRKDGDDK